MSKKELENTVGQKWIYTHQGDKSHSCAYEIPFDSAKLAEEHMNKETKKGYICWGLKKVSKNYTLAK